MLLDGITMVGDERAAMLWEVVEPRRWKTKLAVLSERSDIGRSSDGRCDGRHDMRGNSMVEFGGISQPVSTGLMRSKNLAGCWCLYAVLSRRVNGSLRLCWAFVSLPRVSFWHVVLVDTAERLMVVVAEVISVAGVGTKMNRAGAGAAEPTRGQLWQRGLWIVCSRSARR